MKREIHLELSKLFQNEEDIKDLQEDLSDRKHVVGIKEIRKDIDSINRDEFLSLKGYDRDLIGVETYEEFN